jgi:1,4-alpha-glucan branching enzyme
VACIANLTPMPQESYRIDPPKGGRWAELLNTDGAAFGGSGIGNGGAVVADDTSWHGLPFSAQVTLPPLAVLWLAPEPG